MCVMNQCHVCLGALLSSKRYLRLERTFSKSTLFQLVYVYNYACNALGLIIKSIFIIEHHLKLERLVISF